MDPALRELLREGDAGDTVPAIVRLAPGQAAPPHLRIVARFGDIATVRIQRGEVDEAYASDAVRSFKAIRPLLPELPADAGDEEGGRAGSLQPLPSDRRREADWPTGRGTVVAALDWGIDFTHPDFRHTDGRTRLLAIWDQSQAYDPRHPNRYGYGRLFDRQAIDEALRQADPFVALGYDPRRADRGAGTHGTHVLGIAAGNGRGGGPEGLAPEAGLVFVHMGTTEGRAGSRPLTDSAAVLEGLDFVHRMAGMRPACINLSMGTHGGPHDGSTLVEQGIDAFVTRNRGRYVVQSTGNYFNRRAHSAGRLATGQTARLPMLVDAADTTPNDLEVWYSGRDQFEAAVEGPDGVQRAVAALGERGLVLDAGQEIGRLYHRRNDPNNGDHQILLRLDAPAATGRWTLVLRALQVADGRFHAWIERDGHCPRCQSIFPASHVVRTSTTGSICNGRASLVVGAYDAASPQAHLGHFSSAGPTRDGRGKPDLVAPGVGILAARSSSVDGTSAARLVRMSGTSMAAPHVTGTLALLCELLGGSPPHALLRGLLLDSCRPHHANDEHAAERRGAGQLDAGAAIARARRLAHPSPPPSRHHAMPMTPESPNPHEPVAETLMPSGPATGESQSKRRPAPLIAPVIGPAGLGAAVVAPFGNTTLVAPLSPMAPPPSVAAPVVTMPATTSTPPSCTCQPQPPTGNVTVASTEPVIPGEPPLPAVHRDEVHLWQIRGDDALEASRSLEREAAWMAPAGPEDASFSPRPLNLDPACDELAEASLHDQPGLDAAGLVRALLARIGAGITLPPVAGMLVPRLFDHFIGRREVLPAGFIRHFERIAGPGEPVPELRPGDWLLRRGEGGVGHIAVIASPHAWDRARLQAEGWQTDSRLPGRYVHVVDPAHGGMSRNRYFARRLGDDTGRLPMDTLLLRPLPVPDEESVDARWVQQALNRLIGADLEVDGIVGPRTRDAIRTFQRLAGLVPDGIVGPLTEAALRRALADGGMTGSSALGDCSTLDGFAQGSAQVLARHQVQLVEIGRRILREGVRQATITGFASAEGEDQDNLRLGQRRAEAVARALSDALERLHPGSGARLTILTRSRGEREQIADGDRSRNRRVLVCLEARTPPPPPRPIPPQPPIPNPVETRVFRVTGKSFIARVGGHTGSLDCAIPIGPVQIPGASNFGLAALARATDLAFSEDPRHDRVFTAPPPENKGYRLFSQGQVEAVSQGGILLDVRLRGGLTTDAGRECLPGTSGCMQAPPLIIHQPFSIRRLGPTTIQFRWGVKGRPPPEAELVFNSICIRSSVYIWHELVGVVDLVDGKPVITRLFIQGSRFPSHRAWLDGAEVHHVPQGPMSALWEPFPGDPTRVR